MKRFGLIATICVGFVAGIAFVYSCGGSGGNNAVGQPLDASYIRDAGFRFTASTATHTWTPHGAGESFVLTDVTVNSNVVNFGMVTRGECWIHITEESSGLLKYAPGFAAYQGTGSDTVHSNMSNVNSFESGFVFAPGEGIVVINHAADKCFVFLSGYIVPSGI